MARSASFGRYPSHLSSISLSLSLIHVSSSSPCRSVFPFCLFLVKIRSLPLGWYPFSWIRCAFHSISFPFVYILPSFPSSFPFPSSLPLSHLPSLSLSPFSPQVVQNLHHWQGEESLVLTTIELLRAVVKAPARLGFLTDCDSKLCLLCRAAVLCVLICSPDYNYCDSKLCASS